MPLKIHELIPPIIRFLVNGGPPAGVLAKAFSMFFE
jgi:hypothetical protein